MKQITVDLTEEQIADLRLLYDDAANAFGEGKPGIIIAQCTSSYKLQAAFIPHEKAKKIQRITHSK